MTDIRFRYSSSTSRDGVRTYKSACSLITITKASSSWNWETESSVRSAEGRRAGTEGSEKTLSAAKAAAEAITRPWVLKAISMDQGKTHQQAPRLRHSEVRQQVRGLPRPTLTYNPDGDPVDEHEKPSAGYKGRFGRARELPVMYSTMDGRSSSTDCSTGRLLECFFGHLCSCCGESIMGKPDQMGWIVNDQTQWGVPGSPLCTHCANMTAKLCPHFALEREKGRMTFTRISGPNSYRMYFEEGGCNPDPDSNLVHVSSYEELQTYVQAYRKSGHQKNSPLALAA